MSALVRAFKSAPATSAEAPRSAILSRASAKEPITTPPTIIMMEITIRSSRRVKPFVAVRMLDHISNLIEREENGQRNTSHKKPDHENENGLQERCHHFGAMLQ